MPFRKRNEYSENSHRENFTDNNSNKVWYFSDTSYEKSLIWTNTTISIIIIAVLIMRLSFYVDLSAIQNLVQITGTFGALALAIPLFLKDFKVQEPLWRSFLILSSAFVVATIIGVIIFVVFSQPSYKVEITFIYTIVLIVTINFRTFISFKRLSLFKKKTKITSDLRPSKIFDFIFILVFLIVSILFSKGIPASFFIISFYSLVLLVTILISSILSVLTEDETSLETLKTKLKISIEHLLENHLDIAFTEQKLIEFLREKEFVGKMDEVSRTMVQEAVSEMDIEIKSNLPKVTICDYNLVIPRWNDRINKIAIDSFPLALFYKCNIYSHYNSLNDSLSNDEVKNIINYISIKSGLSTELLNDGYIIEKLYQSNYVLIKSKLENSYSMDKDYIIVFNKKMLEDIFVKLSPHPKSLILTSYINLYNPIRETSYISSSFDDKDVHKIITNFIFQHVIKQSTSLSNLVSLNSDDILSILGKYEKLNIYHLSEILLEKLFENLPENKYLAEEIQNAFQKELKEILEVLVKNNKVKYNKAEIGDWYFT